MLLNNLINFNKMCTFIGMARCEGNNTYISLPYAIKDTSGKTHTQFGLPTTGNYNHSLPFFNDQALSVGISYPKQQTTTLLLGTGTTPVTANDYVMESMITSGLTAGTNIMYASQSIAIDVENNKCTKSISMPFSVKNTSSNPITVTEAGLVSYYSPQSNSSGVAGVLVHREVFEPITIPAGGIKIFQFDFEFVTQLA